MHTTRLVSNRVHLYLILFAFLDFFIYLKIQIILAMQVYLKQFLDFWKEN